MLFSASKAKKQGHRDPAFGDIGNGNIPNSKLNTNHEIFFS